MEFRSNHRQHLSVRRTQYCGDGCCGWTEWESELLSEGEVVEVSFDYCDGSVDEDSFVREVHEGYFMPVDDEAHAWCLENCQTC